MHTYFHNMHDCRSNSCLHTWKYQTKYFFSQQQQHEWPLSFTWFTLQTIITKHHCKITLLCLNQFIIEQWHTKIHFTVSNGCWATLWPIYLIRTSPKFPDSAPSMYSSVLANWKKKQNIKVEFQHDSRKLKPQNPKH